MNKFKVGDVVWVSSITDYCKYEDYPEEYFGQIGVIHSIESDDESEDNYESTPYPYKIIFKDNNLNDYEYEYWHSTNLTLLTETAYLNKTTYKELAVDISNHVDSTIYHISWLEEALENFKKEGIIHSVNGNMTMNEFIRQYGKKEG